MGFWSNRADQCVYVKNKIDNYVFVCLNVDDMFIAAKTSKQIQDVRAVLKNSVKMKELGKAKFIFEMEIEHARNSSMLMTRQARYIDDVVNNFNQIDAKQ